MLCSILNVVVDHSMEDPTPMEPREYQASGNQPMLQDQHNERVSRQRLPKVPVIRIFGPIVRDPSCGPLQSACLHVHGAFPYLLARPTVAGPDGSLRRATPQHGQTNWDDPRSVEQLLETIQRTLEEAIQALDIERQQPQDGHADKAISDSSVHQPVIRRISVVMGRGFFTYCPGPPAPFLRIEYYDPKLRWKVKMILERGLQVPMAYHPDPAQYDREDDEEAESLQFHCFEAHIPYTMQFFKDWNLAGMSYIHVRRGKIRSPLKNSTFVTKYRAQSFDEEKDLDGVFLQSNTPSQYKWSSPGESPSSQLCYGTAEEDYCYDSKYIPPEKSTNSDVEIDCMVQDLQNIDGVIKSLPSDQDERDKVQWRAVPSLQEIWRQERRRMAKLLPPAKDFLTPRQKEDTSSSLTHPPFTLNVKSGAERSGCRLAVKGMTSLVKLTHGLEKEFQRALRQIIERHYSKIQVEDRKLKLMNKSEQNESSHEIKGGMPSSPNLEDAVAALSDLVSGNETTLEEDPSLVDAIDALESFRGHDEVEDGLLKRSSVNDELLSVNQLSSSQDSHYSDSHLELSSPQDIDGKSESFVKIDDEILSQRLDRGESIIENATFGRPYVEEYIDTKTLLPHETLEFDCDRCRVIFEVQTDAPSMRRVCGNLRDRCQRDGHAQQSEESRAYAGMYKTVSTGKYVDGVLDDNFAEEDSHEEEGNFEETLATLATQIPSTHGDYPAAQFLNDASENITNEAEIFLRSEESLSSDNDGLSDQDDTNEFIDEGIGRTSSPSYSSPLIIHPPTSYPTWVLPSTSPPTRKGFKTNLKMGLHGKGKSVMTSPVWLTHVKSYTETYSYDNTNDIWDDCVVQPVISPPTRQHVMIWNKAIIDDSTTKNHEKARVLETDSNSRKVIPLGEKASNIFSADEPLPNRNHEIEEIAWQPSQPWQLSMSQQSQTQKEAAVQSNEHDQTSIKTEKYVATELLHSSLNSSTQNTSQDTSSNALEGIGAQGGRIHVQGGGTLKAKTHGTQAKQKEEGKENGPSSEDFTFVSRGEALATPISFMSVEIHVNCRNGASRLDSKRISMAPDSSKDKVYSIVYVYGLDPGGGESLQILERCCLFVKFEKDETEKCILQQAVESSMPPANLGMRAPLNVECLDTERRLLVRFSSLVRRKDPDLLVSWDTQSAGLGYLIERAVILSEMKEKSTSDTSSPRISAIDMIQLLGRVNPTKKTSILAASKHLDRKISGEVSSLNAPVGDSDERKWKGSGLGSDWDDRVGAGAAAASIVGRLVFAGWKIVAEEVKHPNYSYLPAVTAAVLNQRIPNHDDLLLTDWYRSGAERWRVLHHRLTQAMATMLLFDALDIIGRAGEAARLSGVEFSQSFPGIRGSQYKVEGVLLRALQSLRSDERGSKRGKKNLQTPNKASRRTLGPTSSVSSEEMKSQTQSPWKIRRGLNEVSSSSEDRHYFFFSPSLGDTNQQEALEVQALTLEPESGHYEEPVVVCDFTALYPSIVIAYNLCYSTCSGKLEYHSTRKEMRIEGRTTSKLGPFSYPERRTATVLKHHFKNLQQPAHSFSDKSISQLDIGDRGYIAPTGTIYVGEDVLKGVLPQVLDEILTTRAMLKRAAKEYKKEVKNLSPAILRQLEARQLALKYVANVTYGYTSATFSGRCAMPLLADTIVECGRKTLRKAINMANNWGKERKWKGARVIYGDTDSLFIQLPGRSHKEAFEFGEELCRAVTADNPPPVQLKLEKVYVGSIMQTMKRYCGMKYESKCQRKPVFEAKGLETVRRDQCSLTQKVLRNALITLFKEGIDGVRNYLFRQWTLIEAGQIPVSDFILTGRVRSKYRGGREGPVQAVLAKRIREADPGFDIRYKERLPYIIVATPGKTFKLKDCVLTPLELLERWDAYTVHSAYYLQRHVNAALARCLSLAPHHIDVNAWYEACPRPRRRIHFWPVRSKSRSMIDGYFGTDVCTMCGKKCRTNGSSTVIVCTDCRTDPVNVAQIALSALNEMQIKSKELAIKCSRCNGCFEDLDTFASVQNPTKKGNSVASLKDRPGGDQLVLPLANCVCIDCPITFKRHRMREKLIEATATCEVLDLI